MTLPELISRFEGAEGPSFTLDRAIRDLLEPERHGIPLNYTFDENAAVRLIYRVMPGAGIQHFHTGILHDARVGYPAEGKREFVSAPTPALALCLALLKAVEGKEVR